MNEVTTPPAAVPVGVRVPKRDEPVSDELLEQIRRSVHAGHIGQVSIYCDRCGFTESMDCIGETREDRFTVARLHLSEQGWLTMLDAEGEADEDVCPPCVEERKVHLVVVADLSGRDGNRVGDMERRCLVCGWSDAWNRIDAPGVRTDAGVCPNSRRVTSLVTLQFAWGGLLDAKAAEGMYAGVHLVRRVDSGGTPGRTLCAIDRTAEDAPGWSVDGGYVAPDGSTRTDPCAGCVDVAQALYPGLPVTGLFSKQVLAVMNGGAAQETVAHGAHDRPGPDPA
jgi:hypothetical protein